MRSVPVCPSTGRDQAKSLCIKVVDRDARASGLFGRRRREDDRSARHHQRTKIKSLLLAELSSRGVLAILIMTIKKHDSRVVSFYHVERPGRHRGEFVWWLQEKAKARSSSPGAMLVHQGYRPPRRHNLWFCVKGNIDSQLCAKYE